MVLQGVFRLRVTSFFKGLFRGLPSSSQRSQGCFSRVFRGLPGRAEGFVEGASGRLSESFSETFKAFLEALSLSFQEAGKGC